MSFEKDQLNAQLAPLDIDGFVNPPIFVIGKYNFKCAVDSDKTIWATEHCADGDLLGWNDLLCYVGKHEEFAIKMIKEKFHLNLGDVLKWL